MATVHSNTDASLPLMKTLIQHVLLHTMKHPVTIVTIGRVGGKGGGQTLHTSAEQFFFTKASLFTLLLFLSESSLSYRATPDHIQTRYSPKLGPITIIIIIDCNHYTFYCNRNHKFKNLCNHSRNRYQLL